MMIQVLEILLFSVAIFLHTIGISVVLVIGVESIFKTQILSSWVLIPVIIVAAGIQAGLTWFDYLRFGNG